MQVNKVNNSPNFAAIYRIPYSEKALMEIKNKVIPPYNFVRHRHAIEIPEVWPNYLNQTLKEVAKNECSSVEWLCANAKNHGLEIPKIKDAEIFVFSGDKDINEFKEFVAKNTGKIALLKLKLRNLFAPEFIELPANIPTHLYPLYACKEVINKSKRLFEEFFSNRKVIDASTPQELLVKMMKEA